MTAEAWEVGVGEIKDAPGRWFAVGIQGDPWIPVAVLSAEGSVTDIDRARARLIAAAPDLLAALRELRDLPINCSLTEDRAAWEKANAVIAKAEGRS